ncbi:MAG: hypothetical protein DSZ29_00805 [Aquificaceae bacterium]|nr:MAG: hypothetical protein DSZ29_00805 [Aquificaceae bacterium]
MTRHNKYNLLLLLLLITAHTAVFWLSDIDIQVANFFYSPEESNVWALGEQPFWMFFYRLGPMVTISIAITALLVILFSTIKTSWGLYRTQAAFILFSFLLGPGLLVNTLFKDHWGRPRPVNIEQFQGTERYVPPLKYNAQGDGKSFPSGHSSLGFAFIAFWFIWRKRKPRWAKAAFGFSLLLGSLFGIARMAAGGHFLSDVFWSLWIPLLSSMALYAFFFHKVLDNDLQASQQSLWKNILYSLVAFVILAYGVFNWPLQKSEQVQLEVSSYLNVQADKTNIYLQYGEKSSKKIVIDHHVNGFGLPFSKQVLTTAIERARQHNILHINVRTHGFFSELTSKLTITIPPTVPVKKIDVKIVKGELIISPVLENVLSK